MGGYVDRFMKFVSNLVHLEVAEFHVEEAQPWRIETRHFCLTHPTLTSDHASFLASQSGRR